MDNTGMARTDGQGVQYVVPGNGLKSHKVECTTKEEKTRVTKPPRRFATLQRLAMIRVPCTRLGAIERIWDAAPPPHLSLCFAIPIRSQERRCLPH